MTLKHIAGNGVAVSDIDYQKIVKQRRERMKDADDAHTESLEGLTEYEARIRHFLLDKKGVPATRHWFDSEVEPQKGRLDPETGIFYFQEENWVYRTLPTFKLEMYSRVLYILVGLDGVLGEIIVDKEDTNEEQ